MKRCNFCFGTKNFPQSEKYLQYHDTRWCKIEHREQELFANFILEMMQAGISWNLILEKEENFRQAFDSFDPQKVANYDEGKIDELMQNAGIIRNRAKIKAAIANAEAFLKIQKEFGSFDRYIWAFTEGKVIDHHLEKMEDMPTKNALSERISADLKKHGFQFVGPVIIYSYLQSIGIINDHAIDCDYR